MSSIYAPFPPVISLTFPFNSPTFPLTIYILSVIKCIFWFANPLAAFFIFPPNWSRISSLFPYIYILRPHGLKSRSLAGVQKWLHHLIKVLKKNNEIPTKYIQKAPKSVFYSRLARMNGARTTIKRLKTIILRISSKTFTFLLVLGEWSPFITTFSKAKIKIPRTVVTIIIEYFEGSLIWSTSCFLIYPSSMFMTASWSPIRLYEIVRRCRRCFWKVHSSCFHQPSCPIWVCSSHYL